MARRRASSLPAAELITRCAARSSSGGKAAPSTSAAALGKKRSRSHQKSWWWASSGSPSSTSTSVRASPSGSCIGRHSTFWATTRSTPKSPRKPRRAPFSSSVRSRISVVVAGLRVATPKQAASRARLASLSKWAGGWSRPGRNRSPSSPANQTTRWPASPSTSASLAASSVTPSVPAKRVETMPTTGPPATAATGRWPGAAGR
jgi:hypothetical protein